MRWGVVVLAALALGACSGGGSHQPDAKHVLGQIKPFVAPASTPTTRPPATTTSTTIKPTDATAIAEALGCDTPEPVDNSGFEFAGLPNPVQEVSCSISHVDLDVTVYRNHSDLAKLHSFTGKLMLCTLLRAFQGSSTLYAVDGDDFQVSASSVASGSTYSVGTLAQARALSRALGLPVVTLHC